METVKEKVGKFGRAEVRKAMKRREKGKEIGPDVLQVEVWRCQ